MKIHTKYSRLMIASLMAAVNCLVLTFIGVAFNYGIKTGFLQKWSIAFCIDFIFAVPLIFMVMPVVQKIVYKLTY